jgi:hypothetical protein
VFPITWGTCFSLLYNPSVFNNDPCGHSSDTGGQVIVIRATKLFFSSGFDSPPGAEDSLVKFCFKHCVRRQSCQLLGHTNLAFVKLKEFDLLFVFLSAEDQPNRGILGFGATLVPVEPPEIEFHLALV